MKRTLFLLSIVLFGCNETLDVVAVESGLEYYPVAVGEFRVYEVEEINYGLTQNDTSNYFIREYITDSIVGSDQVTYLLTRDRRETMAEPWVIDSVWTFSKNENFLSITENNIPFVKLTFPIKNDAQWNGNLLNTRPSQLYSYQSLADPIIDSIDASDHIRVIIEDIDSFLFPDLKSEVYVKGIGLVEKDYFSQVRCTSTGECSQEQVDNANVLSGRSLNQTLISIE